MTNYHQNSQHTLIMRKMANVFHQCNHFMGNQSAQTKHKRLKMQKDLSIPVLDLCKLCPKADTTTFFFFINLKNYFPC